MVYKPSKVVFNWNKSRNFSGNICPKPDNSRNIHHPYSSIISPASPTPIVKGLFFVSPLPLLEIRLSSTLATLPMAVVPERSLLLPSFVSHDRRILPRPGSMDKIKRNQRLNIGKSEPNEINIKSTILWISWKCGKGKLNNYDYELLLRSMMIAWAAWKGLHVANPWHADSAGRNVVYICIHVYIIYQLYIIWYDLHSTSSF